MVALIFLPPVVTKRIAGSSAMPATALRNETDSVPIELACGASVNWMESCACCWLANVAGVNWNTGFKFAPVALPISPYWSEPIVSVAAAVPA